MDLSYPRATFSLSATAANTRPGSSGSVTIGRGPTSALFTDATLAYSFEAVAASVVEFDLSDMTHDGSAWSAGTRQVETATAAGTISGSGNASVLVTAAGMAGSPLTIPVAVTNGDTAAVWAGKVRDALAGNAAVAAMFEVGGSSTSIVLTRLEETITMRGTTYSVRVANDATLNISLDNGTCTGITTAATSASTTSGAATTGGVADSATDFQGDAAEVGAKTFHGVLFEVLDTYASSKVEFDLTTHWQEGRAGDRILITNSAGITGLTTLTLTPEKAAHVRITLIGKLA
jgi:hypothetical protein